MKRNVCFASVLMAAIMATILIAPSANASGEPERTIDPIVSTDWLVNNLEMEDLIILDVRPEEAYAIDHIPGSVNEPLVVPFSAWITMPDNGLLLELPPEEELFGAIGALGIDSISKVVVVSAPNPGEPPLYGVANSARVADTLIYAGVTDVAILDGGYAKWIAEDQPTSVEVPSVMPLVFDGEADDEMFVTMDYVESKIWRANIVDSRDADVYFGATIEPFAPAAGHIRSAVALPGPWMYDSLGDDIYTFKTEELMRDIASGAIRDDRCDGTRQSYFCPDTIVYCGVGGYASINWFILSEVLGYQKVRFYDGSAQEWVAAEMPMTAYRWY